jgi:hypothetical protein
MPGTEHSGLFGGRSYIHVVICFDVCAYLFDFLSPLEFIVTFLGEAGPLLGTSDVEVPPQNLETACRLNCPHGTAVAAEE